MPLPILRAHHAANAAAREYTKRVVLGTDPEQAAAEVGGPRVELERNEAGAALARAIDPEEAELLRATNQVAPEIARAALDSREGRAAWLAGVVSGAIKFEGAFGAQKMFPPAVRVAAARLLGDMHGDRTIKHEVKVEHQAVVVFKIPDNQRLPDSSVVDMVEDAVRDLDQG